MTTLLLPCAVIVIMLAVYFAIKWRRKMAIDQAVFDVALTALTAKVDKVLANQQQPVTPDATVQTFVDGVNAQTARLPE